MKPRLAALLAVHLLLSVTLLRAAGTLVSGPMLGYMTKREALIWVETKDADSVTLRYHPAGHPEAARSLTLDHPAATPIGVQPMKFVLPLLEMGTTYDYSLSVDGRNLAFPYPLTFKTRPLWEWHTPPPDFAFIFGSCAYLNDPPYDRSGPPYGQGTAIFRHMAASGADFMIWGGDNWYLREADYSSASGIWYRYSHDRATPDLQPLYAAMPHYATWDDHDYGSNDSNRSFLLKDVTLAAFKAYWGNQTWGEADNPGVYTKFFWGDAAFFLMDDRFYRDDDLIDSDRHPGKTQYGARQLDWLRQSLVHAQKSPFATFKFIVTGGQVITDFGGVSETFAYYPHEREELLKFIRDQHITGVIFLTGDVHFTELARERLTATQWVYELTSSPFSSSAWTSAGKMRASDPHRVEGTLVADQNYCTLAVSGPKGARRVTLTCFDKANTKRWEHVIREDELK